MVKSLNYFIKFIYGNGFKHFSPPKKVNEKRKPKHKKILIDGGRALFMDEDKRKKYIETDLAGKTGKSLGAFMPYNLGTAPLMATLRIGRLERALGQEYVETLLDSMGGVEGIIDRVPTGADLRAFILYHRPLAREWYKMNKSRPTRTPSIEPSLPYHKVKNGLESEYSQAKPIYRKAPKEFKELIPYIREHTTFSDKMPKGLKNKAIENKAKKRATHLRTQKNRVYKKNKEHYKSVMDSGKTKAESRELNEKEKKFVDELQKKFKEFTEEAKKAKKTRKSKKQQAPPSPPQQPREKPVTQQKQVSSARAFIDALDDDEDEPTRITLDHGTGMEEIQRKTQKK